jgi:hypothetical protein
MRMNSVHRVALVGMILFAGSVLAVAQDAPKPDTPKPDRNDGYDRPTAYPRINFGKRKVEGDKPAGEGADKAAVRAKARVYLLDLSDAMAASVTIDTREVTRIEHMRTLVTRALDDLAKHPDARRGDLSFNLVTFGVVMDFAKGGELKLANAENTGSAKDWVKNLEAKGSPDLHAILSECFKQEPESAALIVGSLPGKPQTAAEEDVKKFESVEDFIVDEVRRQRQAGKKTTLDVIGVGLGAAEKKFYERLAKAGGGNYVDG